MREITVINPVSGGGIAKGKSGNTQTNIVIADTTVKRSELSEFEYYTTAQGDCRRFVQETCAENPNTHFTVHGGDGSIHEAVCGIMDANAGQCATVTICPTGSGNDTIKSLPDQPKGKIIPLDLIKVNDSYSINMLNIGFDCNAVDSAARFKKLRFSGRTFAYIMGVIIEFFKPFGDNFHIQAECIDGTTFTYEGSCLLCAICNGQWCGGGFHNSPASDMSDGVLEMLLVKKTSRLNFLKLIGKYKNGTLLDPETGLPPKGYEHIVTYHRIRSITVSGIRRICLDGELEKTDRAVVSVLPHAIQYRI